MTIHDVSTTKSIASLFHLATCDTEKQAQEIVHEFIRNGDYPYISCQGKEIWVEIHNFNRAKNILETENGI